MTVVIPFLFMTFLAPIWLLGLFPWLAVTIFLLVGRRRRVRIPCVELWKVPIDTPRPKKRIGPPPVGLIFAMIAMLVAILAAGQPMVRGHGPAGEIIVIVDRGISMSAGGRYVAVAREVADEIRIDRATEPLIDLRFVPPLDDGNNSSPKLTVDEFLKRVDAAPPTAVDTAPSMDSAIAEVRTVTRTPVVAISDRSFYSDGMIVQVTPARSIRNVGIAKLVARAKPTAQIMVEVASIGEMSGGAELTISTSGETLRRSVDLPGAGTSQSFFLDVQKLGPTIEASVEVSDDFIADNRAWLVEQGTWPRLEPQAGVPAAVDRVMRLYSSARSPTENSLRIPIVAASDRLATGSPGIIADGRAMNESETKLAAGTSRIADHPVTKAVRWDDLSTARIVADAPNGDWTPVVRFGDRVLVAVRESPARQIWIGFDSPAWQRSADFVVFWANVFEWVGRGGPEYSSSTVGDLKLEGGKASMQRVDGVPRAIAPERSKPAEWPGLYRAGDGTLLAVNSPVARSQGQQIQNWREMLKSLSLRPSGTDLTPWLLFVSMLLIILAVCAWKRSSLTGFSGTFTVASAEKTVDEAGPGSTGSARDARP